MVSYSPEETQWLIETMARKGAASDGYDPDGIIPAAEGDPESGDSVVWHRYIPEARRALLYFSTIFQFISQPEVQAAMSSSERPASAAAADTTNPAANSLA